MFLQVTKQTVTEVTDKFPNRHWHKKDTQKKTLFKFSSRICHLLYLHSTLVFSCLRFLKKVFYCIPKLQSSLTEITLISRLKLLIQSFIAIDIILGSFQWFISTTDEQSNFKTTFFQRLTTSTRFPFDSRFFSKTTKLAHYTHFIDFLQQF